MVKGEQLVRTDLLLKEVHISGESLVPVVKLTVDDQQVSCLLDTGGYSSFLVWRTWFEKARRKCDDLLFGCYECEPAPCEAGALDTLEFAQDILLTVFTHSGEFNFGGGEDPTKQASPLKFFKVVDTAYHFVQLRGLQIGDAPSYYINIEDNAIFDSGSTAIFINNKWQGQIVSFLQNAGKQRVDIEAKGKDIIVSCDDIPYLPSMTFYVEGLQGGKISVEIPSTALLLSALRDECILALEFSDDEEVNIGLNAFFGNYYYFNIDEGKIGFTKVKDVHSITRARAYDTESVKVCRMASLERAQSELLSTE
ncbi:hypothetical protein FOL47_005866 [Perkinsus chesapeaki]|uniref:Peptidase A1 domain-containing protein n=1 Tax=Perkinsus chesapeaki TaxID=330153 RepID=A0A7J6LVB2_PERCH|nr:hypothetical protein FOL47_005866 [Perkinsus chesapeaki]